MRRVRGKEKREISYLACSSSSSLDLKFFECQTLGRVERTDHFAN